ncbi:MAG: hypothetical protein ACOY90_00320 [Candidatus Zhuqueibacterota bacterium]
MKSNRQVLNLIVALFFISLGGWLLHLRVHPIADNPAHYIPFVFGLLNVFVAPFLFYFKPTALLAYLINGFGVILGAITMAAFSLSALSQPVTASELILKTTLADIFILFPKLMLGQMILKQFYPAGMGRLFTPLWWIKHFGYVSIVYALGVYLGR